MSDSAAPVEPTPVMFIKKKSKPRPAARQRSASPPPPSAGPSSSANGASSSSSSAVRMPTKKAVYNPLIQGTKRKSRKDEDWEREDMNDGTDSGVDVNWKASGSAKAADNRAYVTGELDWGADAKEDEEKRKRKKIIDVSLPHTSSAGSPAGWWTNDRAHADTVPFPPRASPPLISQDALNDGVPDDGMYHGAAAYKSHLEQREDGSSNKFKAGPVKASSNIRTITVIDYQPDVCKDYKGKRHEVLSSI